MTKETQKTRKPRNQNLMEDIKTAIYETSKTQASFTMQDISDYYGTNISAGCSRYFRLFQEEKIIYKLDKCMKKRHRYALYNSQLAIDTRARLAEKEAKEKEAEAKKIKENNEKTTIQDLFKAPDEKEDVKVEDTDKEVNNDLQRISEACKELISMVLKLNEKYPPVMDEEIDKIKEERDYYKAEYFALASKLKRLLPET